MTNKDWTLLLLPIILNLICDGIVIVILQKLVIDKYIKRRLLRDEIVKNFLNKLKGISDRIIEMNFDSMRGEIDLVSMHLIPVQDMLAELSKYFNTNNYDLKKFEEKYNNLNDAWMTFQIMLNEYASQKEVTMPMRMDLGVKMQKVYDSLSELIEHVRKNY